MDKFKLRDKISDQLLRITESSLRIGAIQDNLLTYFGNSSASIDNPTVVESSYQLMDMEKNRVRSVLYTLLITLNMTDEAMVLRQHWNKKQT